MKITLFLSLIGIFFAACEQTKSVEYYQNHPEEAVGGKIKFPFGKIKLP